VHPSFGKAFGAVVVGLGKGFVFAAEDVTTGHEHLEDVRLIHSKKYGKMKRDILFQKQLSMLVDV